MNISETTQLTLKVRDEVVPVARNFEALLVTLLYPNKAVRVLWFFYMKGHLGPWTIAISTPGFLARSEWSS